MMLWRFGFESAIHGVSDAPYWRSKLSALLLGQFRHGVTRFSGRPAPERPNARLQAISKGYRPPRRVISIQLFIVHEMFEPTGQD